MIYKKIFLCLPFILTGCQDNTVKDFYYEIEGNDICAVKPKEILSSTDFMRIDPYFLYANGNEIKNLPSLIYKNSLMNLKNNNSKYIFCIDKSNFKTDYLESQLSIDLRRGKTFRHYTFVNYSCVLSDNSKLNISKDEAFKKCK
ncbi:hypothetical protein [Acinetobacter gerneri]|jgi:hypothetical protein|uniref:hypothetical protein n=1 Tax=Acinetobacter gerneri TaxID=202952 RepID=UPI0023F4A96C|nr:hypothetical protein [Acinetobacter gerneri]MCH4242705.1 hypothetical protein [Acinetobacter gerneri]